MDASLRSDEPYVQRSDSYVLSSLLRRVVFTNTTTIMAQLQHEVVDMSPLHFRHETHHAGLFPQLTGLPHPPTDP